MELEVPANWDINIVRQCGPTLKNVLQSKFGCAVDFLGMDSATEPVGSGTSKILPEKRFHIRLKNGLEVTVWKADLTTFHVDAVVNAANTRLDHCGGLAYALSKAGGPDIQAESNIHIRDYFNLGVGQAIVTNAGRLPCKKIIHAVGPHLQRRPTQAELSQAEQLLEKAMWSIIEQASRHCLKSVAIPALSSGLFNFPLPRCADVIVKMVKYFSDNRQKGSPLTDIHLVNIDEPTVRQMERACHEKLSGSASSSKSRGRATIAASTMTVQIENVTLTLRKGRIEEQKKDVIVNTTTENLKLSVGEVSKSISEKAGKRMQIEMDKYRNHPPNQRVLVTKPYGLGCKEVFHILWASQDEPLKQVLFNVVSECLTLAASKQHTSISFPAVGTGNLGLRKDDVANIMAVAVERFAVNSCKKMDVEFVIYPSEDDTFMAFEVEMRSLQLTSSPPSSTGSENPGEASQMRLSGVSPEAAHEAKRWLSTLFSSTRYVIHNNFIQYLGEREFRRLHNETRSGVAIHEFFEKGNAGITIHGESMEDVIAVGLWVEEMLCAVQEEFVLEAESDMALRSTTPISHEVKPGNLADLARGGDDFRRAGLQIVRVHKVENPALKKIFELKGKQLELQVSPCQMYQRIPAQFCDTVCRIGFQREYAPTEEAAFGEGIYFARTVDEAMKVWEHQAPREEFLYFVQAQVQTGNSTRGRPDLIVPPAVGDDPLILYDSVTGGSDISVIFNGHQALPEYIIICKKQID